MDGAVTREEAATRWRRNLEAAEASSRQTWLGDITAGMSEFERLTLNQRACLIRPQMDLPETGVATNSLSMSIKAEGKAEQPVGSRVGDYRVSTVCPSRYG